MACGLNFPLLYFSKGTGEARGPAKPLTHCPVIWDHGNGMTHFAQDAQVHGQVCGQPDRGGSLSSELDVGQGRHF